MEVYLIRHTTPKAIKGICYGQSDVELEDAFTAEAEKVLGQLPSKFDAVYSSPLSRCKRLAELVAPNHVKYDNRLKEVNFGTWELRPWNDIPPSELNPWMKDFVNLSSPQGESLLDLHHRVLEWWQEVQAENPGKIAIITHAGVIRVLLAKFRGIPLDKCFSDISVEHGEVVCSSVL